MFKNPGPGPPASFVHMGQPPQRQQQQQPQYGGFSAYHQQQQQQRQPREDPLRPFLNRRTRPMLRTFFDRVVAISRVAIQEVIAFWLMGAVLIYLQQVLELLPVPGLSAGVAFLSGVLGLYSWSPTEAGRDRYKAATRGFFDLQNAVGSTSQAIVGYSTIPVNEAMAPSRTRGVLEEERGAADVDLTDPLELLRELKWLMAAVGYAVKNNFRRGIGLQVQRLPLPRRLLVELRRYKDPLNGLVYMMYDRANQLQNMQVYVLSFGEALTSALDSINNAITTIDSVLSVPEPSTLVLVWTAATYLLVAASALMLTDAQSPEVAWLYYALGVLIFFSLFRVGRTIAQPFDRVDENPLIEIPISERAHDMAENVHDLFERKEETANAVNLAQPGGERVDLYRTSGGGGGGGGARRLGHP